MACTIWCCILFRVLQKGQRQLLLLLWKYQQFSKPETMAVWHLGEKKQQNLSEGWLNKVPAYLQSSSCQASAKWGVKVEPWFKSYAHLHGPSKISAPYMAGNCVQVEAVRDDLILAECSLIPLRVPEWSWGQGLLATCLATALRGCCANSLYPCKAGR